MNYKHGDGSNQKGFHTLFKCWREMKRRCYDKKRPEFPDYGGRGITVCDEWNNDYSVFKEWALNNGWEKGLSIDRKDNNKNYSPDNCRWTTAKEQARNRRSSRFITFQGKTQTLAAWAEECGISISLLHARLNRLKWPLEKALQGKLV